MPDYINNPEPGATSRISQERVPGREQCASKCKN